MRIPKYELGWYYLLGNIHINGIIRVGWVDSKMAWHSEDEDSHAIYKDEGMIKISISEGLMCWFLVFRPKGYDFNESMNQLNQSKYDLEHSESFYPMLLDLFHFQPSDSLEDHVILLDSMNMENKLKW